VYERLPGRSQVVRDPLRLASLFTRGDQARQDAQARADRAALALLRELQGEAGAFHTKRVLVVELDEDDPEIAAQKAEAEAREKAAIRFSVGVATTGNPPNIAGRLFRTELVEDVWKKLVVRAAWDGSVAAGQRVASDEFYPDHFAASRVADEWRFADELVAQLGGFGDVYVTVLVSGQFRYRKESGHIAMRRGPILPGVGDEHVASLGREMMRAVGNIAPEP
jgi:hypothetical protein